MHCTALPPGGDGLPHTVAARSEPCSSALSGAPRTYRRYTTFSRHYTSHAVLVKIAGAVQPYLRPTDIVVDFACGQNTFAPLLLNPGTHMRAPLHEKRAQHTSCSRAPPAHTRGLAVLRRAAPVR